MKLSVVFTAFAAFGASLVSAQCAPGQSTCGPAALEGACRDCAIYIGNAQGQCTFSNYCAPRTGSCQMRSGQAFCV